MSAHRITVPPAQVRRLRGMGRVKRAAELPQHVDTWPTPPHRDVGQAALNCTSPIRSSGTTVASFDPHSRSMPRNHHDLSVNDAQCAPAGRPVLPIPDHYIRFP